MTEELYAHECYFYMNKLACQVSCVVVKVPPPLPRWQAMSWPFRKDTWLAILLGLFTSGPLLYVVARYSAARLQPCVTVP